MRRRPQILGLGLLLSLLRASQPFHGLRQGRLRGAIPPVQFGGVGFWRLRSEGRDTARDTGRDTDADDEKLAFLPTAELLRLVQGRPGRGGGVEGARAQSVLLARYANLMFEELQAQRGPVGVRPVLDRAAKQGLTKAVETFRSGYLDYSSRRSDVDSLIALQIKAEFEGHALALVRSAIASAAAQAAAEAPPAPSAPSPASPGGRKRRDASAGYVFSEPAATPSGGRDPGGIFDASFEEEGAFLKPRRGRRSRGARKARSGPVSEDAGANATTSTGTAEVDSAGVLLPVLDMDERSLGPFTNEDFLDEDDFDEDLDLEDLVDFLTERNGVDGIDSASAPRNLSSTAREGLRRRRRRRRQRLRQRKRAAKPGVDEEEDEDEDEDGEDRGMRGGSGPRPVTIQLASDRQTPRGLEPRTPKGNPAGEEAPAVDAVQPPGNSDARGELKNPLAGKQDAGPGTKPGKNESGEARGPSAAEAGIVPEPESFEGFAPPKPEPSALDRMLNARYADGYAAGFQDAIVDAPEELSENGKGATSSEDGGPSDVRGARSDAGPSANGKADRRSRKGRSGRRGDAESAQQGPGGDPGALDDGGGGGESDAETQRLWEQLGPYRSNQITSKALFAEPLDLEPPYKWHYIVLGKHAAGPFNFFKVNAPHVDALVSMTKNRRFRNDDTQQRKWLLHWLRHSITHNYVPAHLEPFANRFRALRRAQRGSRGRGKRSGRGNGAGNGTGNGDGVSNGQGKPETAAAAAATATTAAMAAKRVPSELQAIAEEAGSINELGPLLQDATLQRFKAQEPRILVIGDVHGCIDELEALLKSVDYSPGDVVLFLGDLVAKGPDSPGVVQFAREIGAVGVRGNHDFEVIRWFEALRKAPPRPSAIWANEHGQIAAALTDEDAAWLKNCPWYIHSPDLEMFFVHAGFVPWISPRHQNPRLMMNMRNIHREHSLVRPHSRADNDPDASWGRLWKGPETIVYGHDAERGLQLFERAVGIDTACVYGGRLTCMVLPERKLVSVPAKRAYVNWDRRRAAKERLYRGPEDAKWQTKDEML